MNQPPVRSNLGKPPRGLSRPKSGIGAKLAVGGIVAAIYILFLVVYLAALAGSILIATSAILDMVTVGVNFWNIFWTIVGGLLVIFLLGFGNGARNRR